MFDTEKFDYDVFLEQIGDIYLDDIYLDDTVSVEMKRALLNVEIALLKVGTIHMKEIVWKQQQDFLKCKEKHGKNSNHKRRKRL